jgi:hypothetical protein
MSLRVIPTRVHGVLDYLTGSALLAAPGLLGIKDEPRAALSPCSWRVRGQPLTVC